MDKHERDAAKDLWNQIIDRAKENEWSTFQDPNHKDSEDRQAEVRLAFLEAGWTNQQLEDRFNINQSFEATAPTTTEGVYKAFEVMLDRLAKVITASLPDADLQRALSAYFVVEPKAGPFVSTINVMMTNQSIITMGTHFTRFCGLIARAYTRTVHAMQGETGIRFDESKCRERLRQRPDLIIYWWKIFVSFALTGTHALTTFKPSKKHEIFLMEQVALSMEIFALSHELGHHCLHHGRNLDGGISPFDEEFAADRFAAKVCYRAHMTPQYYDLQGHDLQNPYLWSSAGGILVLGALEIFRKVKDRCFKSKIFDTHPEFIARAEALEQMSILAPAEHLTRMEFCSSTRNVLKCVLLELEPFMERFPLSELASKLPDDWERASLDGRSSFY